MGEDRLWPEHLDEVVEEFQACFHSMERYELLFESVSYTHLPLPTTPNV